MDKEDLRLLYSVSVSDIQYFKEQQWKVTNYVLLIFAAFISITKIINKTYCFETVILCLAVIVVAVVGCHLTKRLNDSISFRQKRLSSVRAKLGEELEELWKGDKNEILASKKEILWLF